MNNAPNSRQQDYALRLQELELRQRALKLAEGRLQLDRQATAAELLVKDARVNNTYAPDSIKEAAQNILSKANVSKSPDDSDECDNCEGCEKCDPAD